jgi:uncharacterized Zn finger protein
MTLTVTFMSTSGGGFYQVELLGSPVTKLTCTCPGYTNQKCCKHLEAVLEGDPFLAVPTPTDGYHEALEAMRDSPARQMYERLITGLLTIDEKIIALKTEAKISKRMFYRMLAEGINA